MNYHPYWSPWPPAWPPVPPQPPQPDPNILANAFVIAEKMQKRKEKKEARKANLEAEKKKKDEEAKKPKPRLFSILEMAGLLTMFGPFVTLAYCYTLGTVLASVAEILSKVPH